jgi:HEAT repeat protein
VKWFILAALLGGCGKKTTFDLSIPDAPSVISALPADQILVEASQGGGPSVRSRAIALGIAVDTTDRATWAGRGSYDPDGWVQSQTVDAMAPYAAEPAVREVLVQLAMRASADAYARSHAAVVLAQTGGDDRVRDALSSAVTQTRNPWNRSALALGALALGDSTHTEALTTAVARGDIALELTFIRDLGHTNNLSVLAALVSASERVEEELVLAVAASRMLLGDDSGKNLLISATHDNDPLVQLAVIDAVLDIPGNKPVLKAAMRAKDAVAAEYAALAWDAVRDRVSDRFPRALESTDPELRLAALMLLGRTTTAPDVARDHARRALLDDVPRVRAAAARRLGELGLQTSAGDTERLQVLLSDEDVLVRVEGAGALLR